MGFADKFDCPCCNPYKVAKRLIKMCLSIWMIGDMVMDAVTTKKYHDIARVRTLESSNSAIRGNVHMTSA